jgi:hypothetical protein
MYKLINRFGNHFECIESEVQRYLDFDAVFENEEEKARYELAKNGPVVDVESAPAKPEPKTK